AWAGARGRGAPLEAVEARTDEIGALARALREARGEADDLMATLEDRVRERTAELEKANLAKSSFLANMSHELRTPLNGVVATGDLLVKEARSKRSRELAELVAASGRLLEHVLTDILDFSKIEAGEMRLTPIAFDLDGCVPRIAEIHRSAAEAKGLTLTCTVSPAARGVWVGDEIRVAQILSNLLSNAVKFTETGGVTLAADADEAGLRLTVSDTGIGFPCEESERIFRRFEQADASTTRKFGGTGLGLSICASLCRLMGGSIQARSNPGEGSTFTVVLPLARAEASAVAAQATTETAGREGLRILLAEDHPTNQRVVRLILEPAGVELTVVDDGRKALDAFERGEFDVVLMDLQMPVMDGLEATAAIRALEISAGRARTPIVALTANALDEHVAASRQAGADRHVSKPIHAAVLLGVLQELTADPASVSANPHRAA
ncbi:ATP-binding protein, partial [Caulobacter sp. 17J65-9]|uniref:ATP-binding protein n=1 Tax=Caulobacter sp. 17J65-9 TaxID=2709382 RepID=UPI0013C76932